ncbi:MAG: hypothetical protein CVT99_10480 [Bacteroidetes bacterium HGW-Bacteroidetes-16]|nr:MAG: hypothetical protein CVT99_10480 [Bacteroidetes bacterium HGW-Bacteroidetes-16]
MVLFLYFWNQDYPIRVWNGIITKIIHWKITHDVSLQIDIHESIISFSSGSSNYCHVDFGL